MLELARLVFLFLQVLLSPRYKTEHQLHHDQDTDYPQQQQLTVYDVKDAESHVPESREERNLLVHRYGISMSTFVDLVNWCIIGV